MKSKKIKTKTVALAICIVFLMAMSGIVSAMSPNDDPVSTKLDKEISVRAVSYDHWSVLNVVETITDLGDGTWQYSYAFTNTEDSPIWHFYVWTTFDAGTSTQTTFAQTSGWTANGHDINGVISEYDARNLDSDIIWISQTWAPSFPNSPDSIPVGASVSGFTYIANVYDPSPKHYGYETYGNYAGSDGYVTAVGLTGEEEEEEPTISIYTDTTSYTTDDTMHVGLDVTNPGAARDVRFAVWLELPDGGIYVLTYTPTPVTLPAGLDYSNPDFAVFTLPDIASGTYTWNAALIEPSGPIVFISHNTASWEFVPAVAGAPTEDIAGVLEHTAIAIDFDE
jgi:hypothetical protein